MSEAPGIRKTDSKDLIGQKAESPERDGLSAFSISCLRPGIEIIPGAKCTFEVRLHRSKISEIPTFPPFSKSGKGSPHSAAAGNRCGSGWMESKLRAAELAPLSEEEAESPRGAVQSGFFRVYQPQMAGRVQTRTAGRRAPFQSAAYPERGGGSGCGFVSQSPRFRKHSI